ncbi:hypothetical protein SCUCBS95973_006189 [Sporothrix curviconia]|uniref:Uncharacterized protein n=1 Tax=Sporothrix curviconia TaxID=1260050 RepID=A0ABP0C3H7_9PEZI
MESPLVPGGAPEKIVETYGQLLHGNPFQDRKIVLNKDILDNAKITPVTVVKQKQMIEKFLHTLTELSEEAKRTKGNVLLLIFCHGIDAQKLALAGTKTNDVLSITRLQGALERYVPSPTTSGVTDSTTSQIGSDELHDPFLGPLLSSLYHRRIEEMVALWRMTCPGDENAGYWHIVNAFMSRCAETGQVIDVVTEDDIQNSDSDSEDIDARFNLADIIEYRLNIAQLAEHILYSLGLPRPGNTSCLSWNPYKWSDGIVADASYGFSDAFALQHHKDRLWMRMHNLGFSSRLLPTPQQGPIFSRFNRYLLAAVIEARPTSEAEEERIFHAMLNHIDKAQEFYKAKAQANPDVQRKFKKHFGRIWR